MRYIKYLLGCIGFFIILFILFINYLQNSNPYSRLGERYPGPFFRPSSWHEINNSLDLKSYGLNKPSSKEAMIFDFSKNDIIYNDSILSLISATEYFDDELKEWRSVDIIYNKKKYKAKYRFHGSHTFIFNQGRFSLKIKPKKYINGVKQFSLITGFTEGSAINIFLAYTAQKQNLIAPDPGRIILANINKKIEDYWMTEDLSDDYLKSNYDLEDYHIFENSDNWNRNGGPHFSELDGFYYYLDENYISSPLEGDRFTYKFYKEFMDAIDNENDSTLFSYVDKAYIGRFLANVYFFYDSHHIQGDNNKWLHDFKESKFFPIARNEGVCDRIKSALDFDDGLFSKRTRENGTYDFYKRAMCDDSIKLYRDLELQKLILNKDSMIANLDKFYFEYYNLLKYYNVTFMNWRYRYKKLKGIIHHNSNMINEYINNGEVIFAFNPSTNEMKVATDYRVPLQLNIPDLSFSKRINGVNLKLENSHLISEIVEHSFILDKKIERFDINLINLVSGDTIPNNQIIFNSF